MFLGFSFAFYLCFKCHKPYYGGEVVCEAAGSLIFIVFILCVRGRRFTNIHSIYPYYGGRLCAGPQVRVSVMNAGPQVRFWWNVPQVRFGEMCSCLWVECRPAGSC
jgi:hypothetical protein